MTTNDLNPSPNTPPSTNGSSRLSCKAAAEVNRFMRTDLGNAELFARLFHDKVRHDYARDRWLLWQEHWWVADSDAQVVRLAKQIPRIRAEAVPHIADDD